MSRMTDVEVRSDTGKVAEAADTVEMVATEVDEAAEAVVGAAFTRAAAKPADRDGIAATKAPPNAADASPASFTTSMSHDSSYSILTTSHSLHFHS